MTLRGCVMVNTYKSKTGVDAQIPVGGARLRLMMAGETRYYVVTEEPSVEIPRWANVLLFLFVGSGLMAGIIIFVVMTLENGKSDLQGDAWVVQADCGPMEAKPGRSGEGNEGFVFKGIPFAKPPVGILRWKPPQELAKNTTNGQCWPGVYKANRFRSDCAQSTTIMGTNMTGSEDCLYLNVWAKRKSDKLRPVLVYIHGGGLLGGSSHQPGTTPDLDLVAKMDIVAVTMAYRVNVFGFLALDVLSRNATSSSSGNYGLMDQILALKWVKRNIREFGGDPDLVTVMGSSGGGKAAFSLYASPAASGLFHRIVTMSAPPVFKRTFEEASKDNLPYLWKTNCSRASDTEALDCLYRLSTEEAFAGIPWFEPPYWSQSDRNELPRKHGFSAALVVIEPSVLPVSPLDLFTKRRPDWNPVPILISTEAQECEIPTNRNLSLVEMKRRVTDLLGSFSQAIANEALALYATSTTKIAPGLLYVDMATHVRVTCPTLTMARRLSWVPDSQVFVGFYEVWPTNSVDFFSVDYQWAFHGWSLFAFYDFKLPGAGGMGDSKLYKPSVKDRGFRDFLNQEIQHFIKNGSPQSAKWKTYPNYTAVYGNHGLQVQSQGLNAKQCQFWDKYDFFHYGWML